MRDRLGITCLPRLRLAHGAAGWEEAADRAPMKAPVAAQRSPWPSDPGERMVRVYAAAQAAAGPVDVEGIASGFERAPRKDVARQVEQLVAMRMLVREGERVRVV